MSNENLKKEIARVIAKAWADPAFEKELLNNPEATLKKENIALSAGTSIKFVKSTEKEMTIVIPPKPATGKLSDEELEKLAGGWNYVIVG